MWGLSFSRFESVRKSVRVWLDLREEEEVCWPFKGKHPLKIFVVENIDSLQVSIHSYTNLCFENHSITLSNLIHFLQRPDLKQYLSQYKSFKNHQPLLSLHHHGKESEAPHLPSPLLHRLFLRPSTPGLLPSMMWPLFPLPLSGGRPPSVASSPPDGEAHPQHPPPSDLFPLASGASPLLPPTDIGYIDRNRRREGKYFVFFA